MASITQMDPMAPERAVNETAQVVATVGSWVLALGVILYAARLARRDGTWLPLTVILAIAIGVVNEPLFDQSFHLFFYDGGKQWTWLNTYGFPQPVWTMSAYIVLYGAPALLMMQRYAAGKLTRKWLWRYFIAASIFVGASESTLIYSGLYEYFGDHPFRPGKYPLWLGVMEGAHDVIWSMLCAVLAPAIAKGWRVFLTIPLFVISFCSVMYGAGLPGLAVINADPMSPFVAHLGAAASMILAAVMVWMISLALPSDRATGAVPRFLRSLADRLSAADAGPAAPASPPARDRELVPSGD